MKNIDSRGHVTGKSIFLDDIPLVQGTLHAVVFASPIAHGVLVALDVTEAKRVAGLVQIFTAEDIPGENQIGNIIPDEPLLAEKDLHFVGQPIAVLVAETVTAARQARKLIKAEFTELPPVTDAREAMQKGLLLFPPRIFQNGDPEKAWPQCEHVFTGTVESGAQEHLYLETQGAYALPGENNSLLVHSSTQGPTAIQKMVARVLSLPMHRVAVDVQRLGGAFGGKEDQAVTWACLAAMPAFILQRPVKLVLSRKDDMLMTGKRHPYSSDFTIGLSSELKILAFEVTFYQNGGAAADLSPPVLGRSLFHVTNSYFIPNVRATGLSCKTNLPPNTAFRGFGAPQAMFVMESAIVHAATALNISPRVIQRKNLLAENDSFHYGQKAKNCHAALAWQEAEKGYRVEKLEREIEQFNSSSSHFRKGLAMMPVCFGISFTNTFMNQARALVHVYQDGSIGISTGAVEMGQGVNTKLKQVATRMFSVSPDRIRLESTNTTRVANTSPTAASSGADLNGKALQAACASIVARLRATAAEMTGQEGKAISLLDETVAVNGDKAGISWEQLIETACLNRVNLSAKGHYATPHIHFDPETSKGEPFAYHVYGTAVITVTLDCLRGTYQVDSVRIVHDFGKSLNRTLDLGQVEGAVVQGIGWVTMEEIRYDNKGRLLANALSTYKIPDIYSAPETIECRALQTDGPEAAIMQSKAIGEPPFMYGIGTYFALQSAVRSFNPDYRMEFKAPFTPEKVLLALYPDLIDNGA
jgi:xanthine dehydrogenase large subunit